ncbi:hypothetical protein Mmc1_2095 [Magnetococcus marinus MC-1]|uniref:Uncharacterized protein n=1 Tax=Magnetococcus marinus (strain ATCC BAA-1437 / JCM 17883 / MC-1) TaxID=156889 RepID=A0L9F3_MAGMM|nr:hypothetical protein [Magnetococcus marinus]ABK44596.1 hypothetical protein Mmc1_2095 [Magnetococcus marinus MC-1]
MERGRDKQQSWIWLRWALLTLLVGWSAPAGALENPVNQALASFFPAQIQQQLECKEGRQVLGNHEKRVAELQQQRQQAQQHLKGIDGQVNALQLQGVPSAALFKVLEEARVLSEQYLNSTHQAYQNAQQEMQEMKQRFAIYCGALNMAVPVEKDANQAWLQHNQMDMALFVRDNAATEPTLVAPEQPSIPTGITMPALPQHAEPGHMPTEAETDDLDQATAPSNSREERVGDAKQVAALTAPSNSREERVGDAKQIPMQTYYLPAWLGSAQPVVSVASQSLTAQPTAAVAKVEKSTLKLQPITIIRTQRVQGDQAMRLIYLGSFSDVQAMTSMKLQVSNLLAISPDHFVERDYYKGQLMRLYLGPMAAQAAHKALQHVASALKLDNLRMVTEKNL